MPRDVLVKVFQSTSDVWWRRFVGEEERRRRSDEMNRREGGWRGGRLECDGSGQKRRWDQNRREGRTGSMIDTASNKKAG